MSFADRRSDILSKVNIDFRTNSESSGFVLLSPDKTSSLIFCEVTVKIMPILSAGDFSKTHSGLLSSCAIRLCPIRSLLAGVILSVIEMA